MATEHKIDVIIEILGNTEQRLAQIQKHVASTHTAFDKLGKKMLSLNAIMDVASKAYNVVSAGLEKVIEAGSATELQLNNLTTLYKGNADAAKDMYERLSEYGKATVYDKAGLLEAQKTMMSFGIEGEKAFSTIKQIGDIAMGDSQKMQSLSLAFSQATSTGKLMGQDLLQMINAGFNPLAVISEKTGRSIESLKDDMSKGKISADQLSQAFQWATEEGGLFYQGAEKAAGTTAGKINVLKDSFDEFLVSVFNKVQPLINNALTFATSFLEKAPSLLSEFSPIVNTIWHSIVEIGNSIMKLSPFLAPVKEVFVNHLWPAIQNIWDKITKIVKSVIDFVAQSELIRDLWDGIMGAIGLLADVFSAAFSVLSWVWDNVLKPILDGIDEIYKGFKAAFNELLKPIKAIWAFWQRITGNDAKLEIEEKVTTDDADKTNDSSTQNSLIAAVNGSTNAATAPNSDTNSKATAVATGGTKHTTINIQVSDMIKQVTFNGSTGENIDDIRRNFAQALNQVLGIAEMTIS